MEPAKIQWPEPFLTGVLPKEKGNRADAELCANALVAWANCSMGGPPPPKFGIVMAEIAQRLGILGSPESFDELAAKRWPKGVEIKD